MQTIWKAFIPWTLHVVCLSASLLWENVCIVGMLPAGQRLLYDRIIVWIYIRYAVNWLCLYMQKLNGLSPKWYWLVAYNIMIYNYDNIYIFSPPFILPLRQSSQHFSFWWTITNQLYIFMIFHSILWPSISYLNSKWKMISNSMFSKMYEQMCTLNP